MAVSTFFSTQKKSAGAQFEAWNFLFRMLYGTFDKNSGLAFRISGKPRRPPKSQRDTDETHKKNQFSKFLKNSDSGNGFLVKKYIRSSYEN